jgi:hypothetical protein
LRKDLDNQLSPSFLQVGGALVAFALAPSLGIAKLAKRAATMKAVRKRDF